MNKPFLYTILSPKLSDLYEFKNCIVVVIDVFRATSTIASVLNNGAKEVIPVADVAECIAIGEKLNAITAGERDGKIVDGLQHGNSPLEYTHEFIMDKTLVLTTTNGTKMIQIALDNGADEIITGSFPNLNSVISYLNKSHKNVLLVCSGWKDKINMEDTLFAGAVIEGICQDFTIHCDSSLMAYNLFRSHQNDIKAFLTQSTHWHRLSRYGLQEDMKFCISINTADVLPFYDKNEKCLKQLLTIKTTG